MRALLPGLALGIVLCVRAVRAQVPDPEPLRLTFHGGGGLPGRGRVPGDGGGGPGGKRSVRPRGAATSRRPRAADRAAVLHRGGGAYDAARRADDPADGAARPDVRGRGGDGEPRSRRSGGCPWWSGAAPWPALPPVSGGAAGARSACSSWWRCGRSLGAGGAAGRGGGATTGTAAGEEGAAHVPGRGGGVGGPHLGQLGVGRAHGERGGPAGLVLPPRGEGQWGIPAGARGDDGVQHAAGARAQRKW